MQPIFSFHKKESKFTTMAKRTNKNRNHLSSKDKNPTITWPNLPQQLISLLSRQPKLMQNITSFGGVTKSWRSGSRQCSPDGNPRFPRLIQIDKQWRDGSHKNSLLHVIGMEFHLENPYHLYRRRSYAKRYIGTHFKGYSRGSLVVFAANLRDCYIWPPTRGVYYPLPAWNDLKNRPFKFVATSSQVNDPKGCHVMVLTGDSYNTFAFFRRLKNESEWTIKDYKIKDPYNPGNDMEFSHGIGFKGKFYMLSLQGSLVVIEDTVSGFGVTGIGKSMAVPCKRSKQYMEYLVELNGEIFLVFLISRKSIHVVDDAEIFRLDVLKLSWVKVESLGGDTLCVEDECVTGINAGTVGCRKNCIYYSHDRVDKWWIFDMETSSVSPVSGSKTTMWREPVELDCCNELVRVSIEKWNASQISVSSNISISIHQNSRTYVK